jgi:hypothetical protein
MNPRYPVYVISKGRAEKCLTVKNLDNMNIPYKLIIEKEELEDYSKYVNPDNIIVLPFSNLGQGSIPARNWVWEDSIKHNDKRHWILDDNINGFERLNRNQRIKVTSGTIFKCSEDFVDRYENIAFAGFEYRQFAGGARRKKPPFRVNTRVYSCILVNNSLPYRWRGKYNEDTDICLRALKDKWCTILFQCFLQNKAGTMSMSGGNTDTIYNNGDNRLDFAKSLQEQHPDVVKIVFRYNRWHHEVDYSPFRSNELIKKKNLNIPNRINNYGMKLKEIKI